MLIKKRHITILMFFLCIVIIIFSVNSGFAKTKSTKRSLHRHSLRKVHQDSSGMPFLRSSYVWVEDQQTGETLIQKQATIVAPIASITKLMTAMVVLDANLDLQESIIIEESDKDTLLHSHSRLPIGTCLKRREVLLLALMSSDNRCAHALGRTYPGGADACLAAMNTKARSLGLSQTRFEDTAGLSARNVSSARDLARLADAAYQYRLIREFTTCKDTVVRSGWRMIQFHNTNRLTANQYWQIALSKTGYTDRAGRCLIMQAYVARRPVIIVLLDSQGKLTRIGDANRIKQWLERKPSSTRT